MEERQALKVFRKELGEANIEVDEEELEAVSILRTPHRKQIAARSLIIFS
jgi:hypothetical protein